MPRIYDVIVIGAGAMGSGACLHLSRRGQRVLCLEQFDIPHNLGSSHGFSRMIRMAYYEHPDYVPLLRRAYELWEELERQSGEKLLHITGGIYMGPPQGHVVSGALASARRHGLPHEHLTRAQLASRFGQFDLPEDFQGVFEPRAGFLLPEKVIAAQAQLAMSMGVEIHGREPVLGWESGSGHIGVRTTQGEYQAQKVLFCAGAWTSRLLTQLGVKLTVTRQPMGWVWPADSRPFQMGRFGVWGIQEPDGSLSYGMPMTNDSPGLKLARHAPGLSTDPDQLNRQCTPSDQEEIRAVQRRLPQAAGPILSVRICMYTMSPDGHFILDRLPGEPRAMVAAGFSGHGFKFASVVGEVLADCLTDGKTRHPVGFLGLARLLNTSGK
jgi:sarcosine oxidase